MKIINLSYNNLTAVNSSNRIWPNSNELDAVILRGYTFDDTSICGFYKELNLSRTLVKIDLLHPCNCFVFFIYKDYRLNPSINLNSLMQDGIPMCYQNLINDTNQVKYKEDNCDFSTILQKTQCTSLIPTNPSSKTAVSTTTSSTTISIPSIITSPMLIDKNTTTFTSSKLSPFSSTTTTSTSIYSSVTNSITSTTSSSATFTLITNLTNAISSGSSRILTTTPCLQSTTTSSGLTTISKL